MHRVSKRFLSLTIVVVLSAAIVGAGVAILFNRRAVSASLSNTALPIATGTSSDTPIPSMIPTLAATRTVSPTPTPTLTATSTATATLSTRVVMVTVINPDVTLDAHPSALPTRSATPLPTLAVPSPAVTLAYVPTGDISPVVGWLRYAVNHPAMQKVGQWDEFTSTYRSANRRYLFTDTENARLSLRFLGAAVRVRYARLSSYGVFEVRLDGQVMTTVDAYLPKSVRNGDFVTTEVFGLPYGWHTLEITRLNRRNPDSTGGFVAIDGIDVYQNGPEPTVLPTSMPLVPTFTASPAPVQKIQVLIAPPTVQPTTTLAPPQITSVSLTVAYDQNDNKAIEPAEGVRDLPVQLVTADTNRIIASGVTDAQGYIRLEAAGTAPLRLVVPYFNRFWDIAPRTSGTRITLILPPANRPALIP